ncbi:glutamate--tRNA ligase [Kaistia dalseonensis]|uniref:Glutamate--tRNA ligase n=1 Tax=Kaistia dalseonensis TaxID=410840 RepID=A0ABU0H5K9_9HYPH|nr:glutamate--tRNA ligase [Kaistia dalseonensis]MCX5494220.1 glutamate--tRNA ligase [Kaistia dalseonensis]MDQ0436799.1 glutamyl-tRNA synthetase [Kaistia dalseonensis]
MSHSAATPHSSVTVRFAPSPTGYLHIGNARPALFNWLFALRHGGSFILRLDDTDRERSREDYADAILRDIDWLGIKPHRFERQSLRTAAYDAAVLRLKQAGRLYACYETADELDRRRKRQMARGLPPIYDRAGLRLSDAEKAALEAEGRKPHWRFKLDETAGHVTWDDLVRGHESVDIGSLSDPVLVREDGSYLYTLPSVVDDVDMGVTHVIRGDDHVTNTGVQIQIFQALSDFVPVFGHHNTLTTASGEGLSKRTGALSLGSLAEAGYEPMAVASLAVLIGTSAPVEAVPDLVTLAETVDLSMVSKSPARFDPADLDGLNAKLLHATGFAAVADRLGAMGVGGGEAFWNIARANIVKLADARGWWQVVTGPLVEMAPADAGDAPLLAAAIELLPEEPFDGETWKRWTDAIKAATGRKGRALFMPLRLALTGLDHGPELAALLPLIGRRNTMDRLGERLRSAAAAE